MVTLLCKYLHSSHPLFTLLTNIYIFLYQCFYFLLKFLKDLFVVSNDFFFSLDRQNRDIVFHGKSLNWILNQFSWVSICLKMFQKTLEGENKIFKSLWLRDLTYDFKCYFQIFFHKFLFINTTYALSQLWSIDNKFFNIYFKEKRNKALYV